MTKTYTSKGTPKKAETVTALTDKITKATSIVFAQYQGIKHKQLEELRRTLKKSDAQFVIAKNRLLKRALGNKAKAVEALLEKPTASLFAFGDEVAPLKEVVKFFKAAGFGKIKGGLLGGTVLSEEDANRLSSLPTRDILLGNLARQLNAPMRGLHYALSWNLNKLVWALNGIKEKKGKN
jgi:large subunit ribosomal protein L10